MVGILLSIFVVAALWAVVLFLNLPLPLAIVVTAAVILAWIAFAVVRHWQARKAAGQIEKALKAQADAQAKAARPDQLDEIQGMQAEFAKAVRALKSSKLARGGGNALAVLPWYMIIGPPGGGKSTALRESGLKFPYLSKRGGVRGVGGTRNCEWWLTNDAVLLDTAGRYTTEDEDHDEWMSFLDMLARTRPRKPLNGVILAIPLVDVAAESEEGAAELGRRLRERVDEVMTRLQMVLPVYAMFTKCDLLPGFVETFGNLRKTERGQVWGFTLPVAEAGEKGAVFSERFEELLHVIEERSLGRLAEERQLAARERIYEFPQQLGACRPMLAAFVEALFAEDVYRDAPILRGAYFTSGTQEGRVVDRVMAAMAEAFGIRAAMPAAEPVLEAKSYFLRDVFARVIFPDQHLAFRARGAQRRDVLRRWVLAGAAGAVAAVALVLLVRSFALNRELLLTTGAVVASAAEKLAGGRGGQAPLTVLEPLRERYLLLEERDRHGAPWSMRLGLYRGEALLPRVRQLYAVAASRLLLDAEFRRDVEELEAFVKRFEPSEAAPERGEHGRYYELLKLHLLLTQPRALSEPPIGEEEQAWVGRTIAERWSSRALSDPTSPQLVQSNAEAFAKLLAGDASLALPRHQVLVRGARRVLARLPLSTLAVQKLAAELEGKGYDITLATILGGAPVPALRAGAHVRGAFTRRAYEEIVKARLAKPASLVEVWVVADDAAEGQARAEGEADRLRSRYYAQYIDEWRRFLGSISVGAGLQALPALQDLTHGVPPPQALLFRSVGYNTRIAEAGVIDKLREGGRRKLEDFLQPKAEGVVPGSPLRRPDREDQRLGPGDVQASFAPFVAFGLSPDAAGQAGGAPPPKLAIDDYIEQLSFARDALQAKQDGGDLRELSARVEKARARVQVLVQAQEVGWRPIFQSLLSPPIEAALAEFSDDLVAVTARQWCAAVVTPFQQSVEGRYPFARDGEDAALPEVSEFFKPATGTLWAFYDRMLKASAQPAGEGFELTPRPGSPSFHPDLALFLGRAQGITKALFPPGAGEPRVAFAVQVKPTPRIASVTLTVNGQRYEYINGPEEWHPFTWPGEARVTGASLRVRAADGHDEIIQRDGDWGLFRLIETGTLLGEPRSGRFAVAFKLASLGAVVTVEFRSDHGVNPFVGPGGSPKLLAMFRSGAAIPHEIGRKGGACR